MQLRLLVATALGLAALLVPVRALSGIDEQEAGFRFEVFLDSDDVHVFSTGSDYRLDLSGDADVRLSWDRETVIVPGVSSPPGSQDAVDAISGASRPIASSQDAYSDFRKTRNQLDTGARWRAFAAGYYVSDEEDYFAQKISGGWSRTFRQDNLQLDGGVSYGWDDIRPFADEDAGGGSDRKTTFHWSLVATQVAGPTTMVQGGLESSMVHGLQHNPYRNVYVVDGYVPELHPDERSRWDAFVKVNQYLPGRASLNLSYVFYGDDWGIGSHTLGAKLHQYLGRDVIVRYRYRFYSQSPADFHRDEYTEPGGVDGHRTGDYRMGDFDAHLFGTRVSWNLGRGPIPIPALNGIRADLKYERYFNSNNFSANILESGLSLSF